MNIFFKIDGKLYTAACVGTVLPGVTRRSRHRAVPGLGL